MRTIILLAIIILILLTAAVYRSGPAIEAAASQHLATDPDPFQQLMEIRKMERSPSTAVWFIITGLSLFALAVGITIVSEKGTKLLRAIKSLKVKPRKKKTSPPRPVPQVQPHENQVPLWTDER